jgi:RimJ/RimL family protein N-acetyltransferase
MELVKCEEKHWENIRQLRNMDGVKQGFIKQHHINSEEHRLFMNNNNDYFYVCVDKGQFLGYTGVISRDIRVATHPNHQKKGVASFMINELMKLHPDSFAKVKVDNQASLKLFESCGFKNKYYILEKE